MGWQARDRPNWDIALGAAIAPPLLLLGLGLLPGLSPTAPAIAACQTAGQQALEQDGADLLILGTGPVTGLAPQQSVTAGGARWQASPNWAITQSARARRA